MAITSFSSSVTTTHSRINQITQNVKAGKLLEKWSAKCDALTGKFVIEAVYSRRKKDHSSSQSRYISQNDFTGDIVNPKYACPFPPPTVKTSVRKFNKIKRHSNSYSCPDLLDSGEPKDCYLIQLLHSVPPASEDNNLTHTSSNTVVDVPKYVPDKDESLFQHIILPSAEINEKSDFSPSVDESFERTQSGDEEPYKRAPVKRRSVSCHLSSNRATSLSPRPLSTYRRKSPNTAPSLTTMYIGEKCYHIFPFPMPPNIPNLNPLLYKLPPRKANYLEFLINQNAKKKDQLWNTLLQGAMREVCLRDLCVAVGRMYLLVNPKIRHENFVHRERWDLKKAVDVLKKYLQIGGHELKSIVTFLLSKMKIDSIRGKWARYKEEEEQDESD